MMLRDIGFFSGPPCTAQILLHCCTYPFRSENIVLCRKATPAAYRTTASGGARNLRHGVRKVVLFWISLIHQTLVAKYKLI